MGSRHILKEKFTGVACGLDTRWGQVTIREGLKSCQVVPFAGSGKTAGAGGVGNRMGVEFRGQTVTEMSIIHPSGNVKEPVNI